MTKDTSKPRIKNQQNLVNETMPTNISLQKDEKIKKLRLEAEALEKQLGLNNPKET